MKIYKYLIRAKGLHSIITSLEIPKGAKILDVQWQPGTGIVMWAVVDLEAPKVTLQFKIYGTGGGMSESEYEKMMHLRTIQDHNQEVWHVFLKTDNLTE